MIDTGFSKTEIALIVKALFTAGVLTGALIGGVAMVRLGLARSMLSFGVLQAATNLLYGALAVTGKNYLVMIAAVAIEHVAGAMGLTALIMAMCDPRFSAVQYALLSAVAVLPRYALGYPAGWIADHSRWLIYFVISFVLAMPGLAIVWLTRRRIAALDHDRGVVGAAIT